MCLLVSEILFFSAKSKRRPSLIYSMQIIPVCLYIVVRRKGVSATRRGGLNWTPISLLVGHPCKLFHSHEPHDDAPAPDVEFRLPDDIETDKGRREEVYKDILEILDGSVTSCLEICPRNAFLAPPGPHRSEGVAGTEMRAGRRKKHWRRNRDITEKAYPFCSDSISILWSWLALSPLFV